MSEITLHKRRRDSDLSHVDSDGGDLQFASTRVLKKYEIMLGFQNFPMLYT
ncbi:hypothetical protein OROHE_022348 [Orobanche hederae]